MNKREAEDFVYESYLKAEKYQNYNLKDSEKRRPDFTKEILREKSKTPCVVITGSKGKGSTANMISQILQTIYKVGLMTSPHLVDFCERFKINGENISDDNFIKHMERIKPEIMSIEDNIPKNLCISPMGIQADMALSYFNSENTEFNVFECGKGAKYDDVNNIKHDYAVINTIFLEHTRELGTTKLDIAKDKMFVINGEQKCVYVAEQDSEVLEAIQNRASIYKTPLKIYGQDFCAQNIRYSNLGMIFDVLIGEKTYFDISIPLMGEHQAKNCALAMALCLDVLETIDIHSIKNKLLKIEWPGRMELISSEPFILLDACINSYSCNNVKEVLKKLQITDVTTIIGIPSDKDYIGVAKEMNDISNKIFLTKSQNQHYVFTDQQQKNLKEEGISSLWIETIEEAIICAKKNKKPIVILGTTSVISEIKLLQMKRKI